MRSPLAAAGGLVFVQTTNDGLHALDDAGETAWHNAGGDGTARLTVSDGVLYIVFDGTLYALDAETGDPAWSKELEGPTNDFVGHPVVQEERILVPASTDEGDLYALDPGTRETLWVYDGETLTTELGQAPSVSDGKLFFGLASEGEIHAIDVETGQADWVVERRVELGCDHPVLPDGNVLNRNGTVLEALDTDTGELVWEAQVEEFPDDEMLAGGAEPRAVVVTEQTMYTWSTESGRHTLQAFDAGTGEPQWSTETHLADHAVAVDDVLLTVGKSSGSPAEIVALDGGYR